MKGQSHITPNAPSTASFPDLLYEGKNKAYGSYDLRKRYGRYLTVSFWIALVTVSLGFGAPLLLQMLWPERNQMQDLPSMRVINYSELSAPPPIERRKPKEPPKLMVELEKTKKKYLVPVVKKDEDVPDEEEAPTMDELKVAEISTEDVVGNDSVVFDGNFEVVEKEVKPPPPPPPPPEKKYFDFVQKMPEYPGGTQAMLRFFFENVQYPVLAREHGIQGVVHIWFIVREDGTITDAQIKRGIGGGCDAEALRVVSMMPKWMPGEQGGNKVPVAMMTQIRFQLME